MVDVRDDGEVAHPRRGLGGGRRERFLGRSRSGRGGGEPAVPAAATSGCRPSSGRPVDAGSGRRPSPARITARPPRLNDIDRCHIRARDRALTSRRRTTRGKAVMPRAPPIALLRCERLLFTTLVPLPLVRLYFYANRRSVPASISTRIVAPPPLLSSLSEHLRERDERRDGDERSRRPRASREAFAKRDGAR